MRTLQAGPCLRNSEHGYTLLELLIVIAILALMTGMTVTQLSGSREGPRFEAAVRDIAAALRVARSTALSEGHVVAFWMDAGKKRYGFDGGAVKAVTLDGVSLTAYSAREEQLQEDEARIVFFPDGSATGGIIVVEARNRHASLNIDWMTGNVDVNSR